MVSLCVFEWGTRCDSEALSMGAETTEKGVYVCVGGQFGRHAGSFCSVGSHFHIVYILIGILNEEKAEHLTDTLFPLYKLFDVQ